MPSLTARIISFILRKTGTYRKLFSGGPGFPAMQAAALAAPAVPAPKWAKKVAVSEDGFEGRPVWTFAPLSGQPVATVLYWHGGGYVYPPAAAHFDFLGTMALKHRWRIVAPLYPLAPMAEVGAITGFAMGYYRTFLEAQAGAPFVMGGDSAGAGLAAATAMAARDAGLALPAKLLLICPWLEADPAHPEQQRIEPRDAILTIRGIREAGQAYAGAAGVADPRVSPIHGGWDGLPPILSFGGGDDILVTDARALKAKLPSVDYREEAGMIHDWPIFTFPESRRAQAEMAAFAVG
jgi:epsilon-lactone hydrolase